MLDFNIKQLALVFRKNYKNILWVTLISLITGVIVSSPLIIPPKYKSTTTVYPANIFPYAVESTTEQLLQMLESKNIKDSVIEKLKLYDHYGVPKESKTYKADIYGIYGENVSIEKTMYEAVQIVVMDKDPEMAYQMSKSIADFLNKKIRQLQQTKVMEVVEINKSLMLKRKNDIDSIEARLKFMREEYGFLNHDIQIKEVYRAYYKALGDNNGKVANETKKLISDLEHYGTEFLSLSQIAPKMREEYVNSKLIYDVSVRDSKKYLTYINMVSEPYSADKKSYPVRWIIVLAFTFSGLAFAIVVMLFIEYKPLRRIINN